jgi:hypothetical protein
MTTVNITDSHVTYLSIFDQELSDISIRNNFTGNRRRREGRTLVSRLAGHVF